MAKLKKTTTRRSASASNADLQAKAEHLSRSLVESAQQIWMAGVGAFTRAQGEGSKLFEALVTEGMNIEKTTRKLATGRVDAVRDAMEDRVGVLRVRASDTWDRLEKVFEDRVQQALNRLGIPGREEIGELSSRVDALTTQLRKSNAKAGASTGSARAAKPSTKSPGKSAKAPRKAAKAPSKAVKAPRKASKASRKGAPKAATKALSTAVRKAGRASLPKALKPVAPHA